LLDPEVYAGAIPHLEALESLSVDASPQMVGDACMQLASWFEGRGRLRCALEFAIVAFLARPTEASFGVFVPHAPATRINRRTAAIARFIVPPPF
jgi:hypothetical protein